MVEIFIVFSIPFAQSKAKAHTRHMNCIFYFFWVVIKTTVFNSAHDKSKPLNG